MAIAGPPALVASLFITAALAGTIELLARLQVGRMARVALLAPNAGLVTATSLGWLDVAAMAMLLLAINAALLSAALAIVEEDRFNAALLIGAASLTIIAAAAAEAGRLLAGPSTHMPRLQECIVLMAVQDFFASAGGRLWPRGRLAPRISPNKTLSGAAFGIVGGIGAWLMLRAGIGSNFSAPNALLILVAGVLGDLLFSSVKRALKVKDFGDALGAKGGVLDRIDSTILAVLVASALPS